MFEPRVALASLSGRSDAAWAAAGSDYAGVAFLGGLALDEATRSAAAAMVERDRAEFLPEDPVAFVGDQLDALEGIPIRPAINVRTTGPMESHGTGSTLERVAARCARRGAILEVNAHCRQHEVCAVGSGQALLRQPERLCRQVAVASGTGATVSVKVRTEVPGVSLPALARQLECAGADIVHVDAMDSEAVVGDIAEATDRFVIANNGVRDRQTVREYLSLGADAVSVGRPSDDPAVLSQVHEAAREWFDSRETVGTGEDGRATSRGGQSAETNQRTQPITGRDNR